MEEIVVSELIRSLMRNESASAFVTSVILLITMLRLIKIKKDVCEIKSQLNHLGSIKSDIEVIKAILYRNASNDGSIVSLEGTNNKKP